MLPVCVGCPSGQSHARSSAVPESSGTRLSTARTRQQRPLGVHSQPHIISQSTSLTRLPSTSITTVALSPTLEGLRLTDVSFCFRSSLSIPGSCTRHWPLQQVIFHLNITLHQLPLETQPSLVHHGSPRRRQVQVRQPRKRPSITLSPRQSEAIGAICIVSVGQISSADTHLHP